MTRQRMPRALTGLLSCCVLIGCGSTAVQPTSGQAAAGGLVAPGADGMSGLEPPDSGSATGPVTAGTEPSVGDGLTTRGGQAPGSTSSVSGPGTTSAGPGSTTASGGTAASTTKRPVEVGIMYFTDANAFVGSFGGEADFGDPKVQAQRIVDDINSRGGLNGHKIVPVYHPVTLMDAEPYDSKLQAMCENWTKDHKVIAGLTIANNATGIQACLEKAGVVSEQSGDYLHDAGDYAAFTHMVNPGELQSTVGAVTYVDALVAAGFLDAKDTIGVFYNDYPGAKRAYENGLVPALKRHGLTVTYSYAARFPESTAAIGSAVQEFQGPVLKAASEGVDRVLFLCTACAGVVMTYADSQSYRPKYGLTSWNQINALAGSAPASQLEGSRAVGWSPLIDTGRPDMTNSGSKRCLAVMKEQAPDAASQLQAFSYCDMLYSLEEGAKFAPGQLTSESLLFGLQQLGVRHRSPFTLTTRLTPQARWGVDTARLLAFDAGCTCFRYTGPPFAAAGR